MGNYQTANKRLVLLCIFPDPHDSSHRGSRALATRLRVVDLAVDRLRDKYHKICKFTNTYTQDNKQLFQIIGQIHGAMLLNINLFTLSCC